MRDRIFSFREVERKFSLSRNVIERGRDEHIHL